jgi:hypothetical protein
LARASLSAAVAAEQPIPIAIIQRFFLVASSASRSIHLSWRLASRMIPGACALAS